MIFRISSTITTLHCNSTLVIYSNHISGCRSCSIVNKECYLIGFPWNWGVSSVVTLATRPTGRQAIKYFIQLTESFGQLVEHPWKLYMYISRIVDNSAWCSYDCILDIWIIHHYILTLAFIIRNCMDSAMWRSNWHFYPLIKPIIYTWLNLNVSEVRLHVYQIRF